MRYFVTIDGTETTVDVTEQPGGSYDVRLVPADDEAGKEPRTLDTDVVSKTGALTLSVEGRIFDLVVDGELPSLDVFASGRRAAVQVETARMRATAGVRERGGGAGAGVVLSPMPGKVVKVLVQEGDEVEAGAPLVVVEAMKMENELEAEKAGIVKKVHVAPGDAVEGGAPLVVIG